MYPEQLTIPMAKELTDFGFKGLTSANEVKEIMDKKEGTVLVVVNSVCGCAAGGARPGVKIAIQNSSKKPTEMVTVFAGVNKEAVDTARQYMLPYPPSSPAVALFKDGKLVHFLERHHIEGKSPEMIAANLKNAMEHYCV
jgi:putative YphP/YqiW family bacilliredoxin